MKKIIFTLLILSVLLASCATKPAGITDDTFNRIYDKYFDKLILEGAQTYTVVSGDTLSKISGQYFENEYYYPVIMLASRNEVVDPDKIQPGMNLTIINLEANLADNGARAAIKGVIHDCEPIERERRPEGHGADALKALAGSL